MKFNIILYWWNLFYRDDNGNQYQFVISFICNRNISSEKPSFSKVDGYNMHLDFPTHLACQPQAVDCLITGMRLYFDPLYFWKHLQYSEIYLVVISIIPYLLSFYQMTSAINTILPLYQSHPMSLVLPTAQSVSTWGFVSLWILLLIVQVGIRLRVM